MMISLVLVESALQLVPDSIQSHPQIKRYAAKRGKDPGEVLLDRTFHHSAMVSLARAGYPIEKMGRPDIVHNALLQVLETPLNWEGLLQVFIHTQDDYVISVNSKVRLPKNYVRFVGLIEQLFDQQRVPSNGESLLEMRKSTLPQLIKKVIPDRVVGFSILGKPELLRVVTESVCRFNRPMVFVGAFPKGHFTEQTQRLADEMYRIDREGLDSWIVAGRFVYDCEGCLGVGNNRVKIRGAQDE
ncbi:MAG: 16S rRNA methyltransferase [Candidatus Bathyarchaeia archaeon]